MSLLQSPDVTVEAPDATAEAPRAMTRTELQLLAVHRAPILPLADVCLRYLNINLDTAQRKASLHNLPFPAFKLDEANPRSPWMVRGADLADFLDAAATAGVVSWAKSQV